MTTIIEERGRVNMFAKEPPNEVMNVTQNHNQKAENWNGSLAMLGVIAALGSYAITGQLIPGIW